MLPFLVNKDDQLAQCRVPQIRRYNWSLRSTRPTPRLIFNVSADARQQFAPGSCEMACN